LLIDCPLDCGHERFKNDDDLRKHLDQGCDIITNADLFANIECAMSPERELSESTEVTQQTSHSEEVNYFK
jgi:hypothetical protein